MREHPDLTREEYELTKVALERSDVPAEALALLSKWIEGERLLVDDREAVGGINFCRMDAKVVRNPPCRTGQACFQEQASSRPVSATSLLLWKRADGASFGANG
jgi:hypothetical protein